MGRTDRIGIHAVRDRGLEMEDKKMASTIQWHLVKDEGNPPKCGDYIVTTEAGTVKAAKWWNDYVTAEKRFIDRWKVNKGVVVLAWAEMPAPCEACPIEVIAARKDYERAKAQYEKALKKYNELKGQQ